MLIIGDARIPTQAVDYLSAYGKFIPFQSENLVYEAISGHPDIFFCKIDDRWVMAPNTPENQKKQLLKKGLNVLTGEKEVGMAYPLSATYNAVVTDRYLIHHLKHTDPAIVELSANKTKIHVNQAYTRCSLLPLSRDRFITSDKGIYKTLIRSQIETFYFSPDNILLPGFNHGFFGGCCGIYKNRIFIIGQLKHHADGEKLRDYLEKLNYEIIELYDGPLFDGGSLLFLP